MVSFTRAHNREMHENFMHRRTLRMSIKSWSQWAITQKWNIVDNISLGRTQQLLNLCQKITGLEPITQDPCFWFCNGFHFLNNTQPNEILGVDGYDNYQAPVDPNLGIPQFRRRMWVGGAITFHSQPERFGAIINCEETIQGVRRMGDLTFVTINRELTDNKRPLISEIRKMMYTAEPFDGVERNQGTLPQTDNDRLLVLLSHTALRRYSFLTNNLHRIHIDSEYARGYEGLPDVIVHGPFMVTLVLYWLSNLGLTIKTINYRNYAPCIVNDSVTFVHNPEALKVMLIDSNTKKKFFEATYS